MGIPIPPLSRTSRVRRTGESRAGRVFHCPVTRDVVTGGGNGPYYLLRHRAGHGVTDFYLLAVLNHPVSEAFIRMKTSVFRGEYYSHGRQFIKDLPVPIPSYADRSAVDALVVQLMAALADGATARMPHERTLFERVAALCRLQIDAYINRLFALTAADMDIIRGVPIPE